MSLSLEKENSFFQNIINFGGKISALLLGLIYICGFLVLNSHFHRYGISDLGLTNSNYLIAGALFILYIATYALFGGRSIVQLKKWMAEKIEYLPKNRFHTINSFIAFIHSNIELVFFHCISAAMFTLYAFENNEAIGFYIALALAFLIDYPLVIFKFDIKYPVMYLLIDIIIKVSAIIVFFILSSSSKLTLIFFLFAIFSLYINFVIDQFERYKITRERIIFTIVYSFIFFLGSSVAFGINKQTIGNLSENYGDSILRNVFYLSNENIYYIEKNETIVLPRSAILWMKFPQKENNSVVNIFTTNSEKKK